MYCVLQNDTSSFLTYVTVPKPENDENATQTAENMQQEDAAVEGMEREAAQLFHALWLAMKEKDLLAVGMYKGATAWLPHPVAVVVQEQTFAESGEQVRRPCMLRFLLQKETQHA